MCISGVSTMSGRSEQPPLDRSVFHLIHRAQQCADTLLQSRTLELDLTPTQITVLAAVSERAGSSQADLCAATGIDRSTMADVVRRMVKKGLLRRASSKRDARTYAISLTNRGQSVLSAAAPIATMSGTDLLAVVPRASRERFVEDLRKIISAFAGPGEKSQRDAGSEIKGSILQ